MYFIIIFTLHTSSHSLSFPITNFRLILFHLPYSHSSSPFIPSLLFITHTHCSSPFPFPFTLHLTINLPTLTLLHSSHSGFSALSTLSHSLSPFSLFCTLHTFVFLHPFLSHSSSTYIHTPLFTLSTLALPHPTHSPLFTLSTLTLPHPTHSLWFTLSTLIPRHPTHTHPNSPFPLSFFLPLHTHTLIHPFHSHSHPYSPLSVFIAFPPDDSGSPIHLYFFPSTVWQGHFSPLFFETEPRSFFLSSLFSFSASLTLCASLSLFFSSHSFLWLSIF